MHLTKNFVRVAALPPNPANPAGTPFQSVQFQSLQGKADPQKVESALYAIQQLGLSPAGLQMLSREISKMIQAGSPL